MSDLRSTIENASPGRSKWPWIAGVAVLLLLVVAGIGFAVTRGSGGAEAAADGDIVPSGATLLPGYLETQTPGPYTAVVRFGMPLASFLQASSFTANAQPGFLSLSTLKLNDKERTDPKKVIGTGPFVYESREPQVKTVLVKRAGYDWSPKALPQHGEAYLDKVLFNTIPEASVRTGSLVSGTIDATLDVGTTDEKPLAEKGFKIYRGVSGTAIYFNFNSQLFPTNDIAVRKAIQLGWDREAIKKTVLTDSYSVATSVLAPSVAGYADYSGSLIDEHGVHGTGLRL